MIFVKISYMVAICCLLLVVLTSTKMVALGNEDEGVMSLANGIYGNEALFTPTNGVLSTGVSYSFIGEFDFREYRETHNFNWERMVDGFAVVNSPAEAAEVGQFYLAPNLNNNPYERDWIIESGWIITVHYCYQIDSWVIQWKFPEDERIRRLMTPTNIFSINRSTGNIVEYFDNMGSLIMSEQVLTQNGWQRTLGDEQMPESRGRHLRSIVDFFQRFTQ